MKTGRIVIAASTILDGRGHVLKNTRIVVEGTKIVAIDPKASPITYDLRGLTVLPRLDRCSRAHHVEFWAGRQERWTQRDHAGRSLSRGSKCVAHVAGRVYDDSERWLAD